MEKQIESNYSLFQVFSKTLQELVKMEAII